MRIKSLSFFVGIILLVSLFTSFLPARAWTVQPQKVNFGNIQGINLIGWLFKPDGNGPYPAVVMMHGCLGAYSFGEPAQGINSLYREWGDRLVNAGYVALLIDSFTPRNALQNQCRNGTSEVSEVNDRPYDAYAGLNYLSSQAFVDANKIALLGWWHGGSSTMATMDVTKFAADSSFKAAVAFYPDCGLSNAFGGIRRNTWKPYAPFVILHGSADTVANPTTCMTRVLSAQQLGATNVTINIFENAQHHFDGAKQVTDAFTQYGVDAKIAADAQIMHFFGTHLR
ncbi:MAG TPA: dienelactone hydrolase family protein [Anaerolineales bacterium]|nr:dienelactone hydrolase family protein [Anaerolineales bacterium]